MLASCTTFFSVYVSLSKNSFFMADAFLARKRMQRYNKIPNPQNFSATFLDKNKKFSHYLTIRKLLMLFTPYLYI